MSVETKVCCIDECDNTNIAARGMCWMHYQRWRRHGEEAFERSWPRYYHCIVSDCDRPHYAKGYCTKHYRRWLRWGDATYKHVESWDGTLEGLLERTVKEGDCMIWTGAKQPRGYPVVSTGKGVHLYVHRTVWELSNKGKSISGGYIVRTCGNPSCINPDHLEFRKKKES